MGIFNPFRVMQFIITKSIDGLLIRCGLTYDFCTNIERKKRKLKAKNIEYLNAYIMIHYTLANSILNAQMFRQPYFHITSLSSEFCTFYLG